MLPYHLPTTDHAIRVFKTRWFNKLARKAGITDDELCEAVREVMQGQGDDLGGGGFKKRLNKNRHRSIILARGRVNWIYAYLFAKKDRDNIEDDELDAFRKLAGAYEAQSPARIALELQTEEIVEICHGKKN